MHSGVSGHDAGIGGQGSEALPYLIVLVLRISSTPRGWPRQLLPEAGLPAPRTNMRKIKDVLRLKLDARLSHEQIATSLGISKGAASKYVGKAAAAGLDWNTIQPMSEIALERYAAFQATHAPWRAKTAATSASLANSPCSASVRPALMSCTCQPCVAR